VGDNIILHVGDILYDTMSKDIGVLIERKNNLSYREYPEHYELWVWEVYWNSERGTFYTESGLINMIKVGHLLIFKNI
tara:strand:+ start:1440 stop:1673 length:234 start_codon:yes stop_codon:yes gene_type:complete